MSFPGPFLLRGPGEASTRRLPLNQRDARIDAQQSYDLRFFPRRAQRPASGGRGARTWLEAQVRRKSSPRPRLRGRENRKPDR